MGTLNQTRRDFLKVMGAGAATMFVPTNNTVGKSVLSSKKALLGIDPRPRFDLSPYLYMQFMEPLGTTDGSVSAAWDFKRDCWRKDVIEVTKELAPSLIRWGGCFSSYYRWKEGVGPRDQRKAMINLLWGGMESNQVGTAEFVDFCRQVGAEPLMSVNFESDGRKHWMVSPKGDVRSASSDEAAEWVDYCNNPVNELRLKHGVKEPHNIKMWQIGNETSYSRRGYDCETAAKRTVAFAKAMRKADPEIRLIGWGDSGWASRMYDVAGEHLQYLAFHHMFNPDRGVKDSPLRGIEYRKDPAKTWEHLMRAYKLHEVKIRKIREQAAGCDIPLALTECHFVFPGRNRCEVLSTWAAGVAYARLLNVQERNGDVLKIATLADFCGTIWQNNAIMIPTPGGKSFMMPVAMIMSLYRRHTGQKAVDVTDVPEGLDVTASRTGNKVFLHVVNTKRTRSVTAQLAVGRMTIGSGRVFEIAIDPELEVFKSSPELLSPKQKILPESGLWTFAPACVSAIELEVKANM
ncbi:MAG: alpha-L-arabinofuranosidase [Planctomycetota bacterium]|jgi:hypothetical protein